MVRSIIMLARLTQGRPLFFLYVTVFINMVGFGMVFPLLPFYAQEFNASAFQIGLMAASFSIVQFFTSPVLGRVSDRFGRKPVLVVGLLAGTVSMLMAGTAQSLAQLFIARSFHGAVTSALLPTARAYMADVTTAEERVAGMGKVGAAFALGFLIGPAFGSFLVALGGIHVPFFVSAAVAAGNAVSVALFLKESLSQKTEKLVIKEGLFNIFTMFKHLKSETGILLAVLFAWSFALSNNQVAFPLTVSDTFSLGPTHIGYFFTAMAIVSSAMQGVFLKHIVKFFGEKRAIMVGLGFQGVGLLLITLAPTVFVLIVAVMVMAMGSALHRPTAEGIISRMAETGQGTTLGIANSFESLGRVFGPLLGGMLYGVVDAFPFILSAALLWVIAGLVSRALVIKPVGTR
ncbi:MFS transporter [Candidatus Microgenomates bacterium]|nr:MFS transporter [Candidatus Microgenomates bacterium]